MDYQTQVGQVLALTVGAFLALAVLAVIAGAAVAYWQDRPYRAAQRAKRSQVSQ